MNRNVPIDTNSRGGSALLVVLVILGAIAVFATVIARSVSGAAFELRSGRLAAESESDLRAGIELGVAAILKLGDGMRRANVSADLSGRRLTVRVTNERARIDLNRAKRDVLTGLLKAIDIDDAEAAALATNIVEWRGGAGEQPVEPTENQHFGTLSQALSLGSPTGGAKGKESIKHIPSLRVFVHPFQLAMVPGFSAGIVRRLFPLVTVANGAYKINPFIAPREVLSALPDVTNSAVDAFIGSRAENVGRDTAIQLLGADKRLLSEERAGGWLLQIASTPRVGRARHSEVVIAGVDGSVGEEPYRVLYVIDDADQQAWQVR